MLNPVIEEGHGKLPVCDKPANSIYDARNPGVSKQAAPLKAGHLVNVPK